MTEDLKGCKTSAMMERVLTGMRQTMLSSMDKLPLVRLARPCKFAQNMPNPLDASPSTLLFVDSVVDLILEWRNALGSPSFRGLKRGRKPRSFYSKRTKAKKVASKARPFESAKAAEVFALREHIGGGR